MARLDGQFGVLPETPSPIIQLEDEDPLLKTLVAIVQAADKRRGIDMSAFWIQEGFEIVVIITALSRPQLQAIAEDIDRKMRKEFRLKKANRVYFRGQNERSEAASGWRCLKYNRITVHVMTPVQRTYYNIEGTWRDDHQDYEKIPLDELLREDGFGNLRLTKELGGAREKDAEEQEPVVAGASAVDYDEDEDDPFWS